MTSLMPDVRTPAGKGVAALGLLTFVGLGAYLMSDKKKRTKKKKKRKPLTLEEAVTFYRLLCKEMQLSLMEVGKQEQRIRQNFAQTGQSVSEAEMMGFCKSKLDEMMDAKEKRLYSQLKTSQEALEEAAENFAEDAKFKDVVSDLNKLYSVVNPSQPAAVPDSFGVQELMKFMKELMESMNVAMESTSLAIRTANPSLVQGSQSYIEKVNESFAPKMKEISDTLLKKFSIDNSILQTALQQHQTDPELQKVMEALGAEQNRRFSACGVSLSR